MKTKFSKNNQYSGLTKEQLFWEKVDKKGVDECWNWIASAKKDGYGRFYIDSKQKYISAHRFSYELFNGKLKKDKCIDHLCRNKICVNPKHLEQVTGKENTRRGNSTKINISIVQDIRKKYKTGKYFQSSLALLFGISKTQIYRIINNQRWAGI